MRHEQGQRRVRDVRLLDAAERDGRWGYVFMGFLQVFTGFYNVFYRFYKVFTVISKYFFFLIKFIFSIIFHKTILGY